MMEEGADPMNVIRDQAPIPKVMHGGQWKVSSGTRIASSSSDSAYNKGYDFYEDANRYGPAMPQIIEMIKDLERLASPTHT